MVLTPLQRFFSGIPSETSKPTYKLYLDKFFNNAKINHDEFLAYETNDQEALIEQYIFHLKRIADKTGKYQNSFNTMIAPLKLFCTMNKVPILWARLYKMFPKTRKLSNRLAYDDNDIKSFLDVCNNSRDIAFIHFMASTAVRIGEVNLLNIRDITPIEDGAIVNYYAGEKEEYKVCLTPEAYGYLKKYLETRTNRKPEAPLFTSKKGIMERRLAKSTVSEFMKDLRYRINPNKIRDGKRKDKAPNNAYRKRLENIFAVAEVPDRFSNYLLDHNKADQDPHYFTDISNEMLWSKFKKAIPLITLDKSNRIIASKDDEIEKLRESYEGEFKEKLEKQDELIKNLSNSLSFHKFNFYVEKYTEEGKMPPNLDQLRKHLTLSQIDDWNGIVKELNNPEYTIKIANNSETRLKNIQELKEMKSWIKNWKKIGLSKSGVAEIKKCAKEFAEENSLDYKHY